MAGAQRPIIHGGDHGPGGADPLRSSGATSGDAIVSDGAGGISWGAASGPKQVLATWGGTLPATTGTGQVWRVPYASDGSSYTFSLVRAFARLDDPVGGTVTFRIEKSAGGGAFSPTTVTTLTIAAGDYDDEDTSFTVSVTSGDLLRIAFVAVSGTPIYSVQLIGSE